MRCQMCSATSPSALPSSSRGRAMRCAPFTAWLAAPNHPIPDTQHVLCALPDALMHARHPLGPDTAVTPQSHLCAGERPEAAAGDVSPVAAQALPPARL